MHMTSRVTAPVNDGLDALDILGAAFPAGTVSYTGLTNVQGGTVALTAAGATSLGNITICLLYTSFQSASRPSPFP